MKRYVDSSPHLLRLVKRSALAGFVALLVLAAFVPAPLEMPADPSRPPNPAKSAWFLLWIQELVSYGTSFIYAAVALVVLLLALPWLPLRPPENASWFPRSQRVVSAFVLAAFALVLALTLVASFLRGPNWRLDFPF